MKYRLRNQESHCAGKPSGVSSLGHVALKKKLFFEKFGGSSFRFDPTIPLLGLDPQELKVMTQTGAWTRMFTAALYSTAEDGNNPGALHRYADKQKNI